MSNLPPGVSVNDIPGNRPEDEWFEKLFDKMEVPPQLVTAVDPEVLAREISKYLESISWYYGTGMADGMEEGRINTALEQHSMKTEALCGHAHPMAPNIFCQREEGHRGSHHHPHPGTPLGGPVWWDSEGMHDA